METIDIKTTQNVTIEYELANLRERAMAFFIDMIILFIGVLIIFLLTLRFLSDTGVNIMLVLFTVFGPMLYQLTSEIIGDGQSVGKKAMNLKVVRLDGREPSLSDYLLRSIFLLLDFLLSAGVLAAILVTTSARKQRLGDMTANTTVIRTKSNLRFRLEDILKINSLENYEPAYPQVKNLSEKDMLTIKSVITRYRNYPNPAHRDAVEKLSFKLKEILSIEELPNRKIEFLRTLLRDYIVLTR